MNQLEKVRKEEKELEDKLFGTDKETETKETEAPVEDVPTDAAPSTDETVNSEEKPVETEVKPQETEDWEKRYKNLRASRDSKLYDAQVALANATDTIQHLQQKIEELEKREVPEVDIFEGSLTDEEREALGEATVEAMRKTSKAAVSKTQKKLEDELAALKADRIREANDRAKQTRVQAYDTFLNRLADLEPNYESINTDPGFIDYMQQTDIDGILRADHFKSAESRGDARTIALYMKDYVASKNPRTKAKADLENKITPTGTNVTKTSSKERSKGDLTMAEVNAHYTKFSKGGYKGKHSEYLAMEARINKAASAGKIIG